VYLSLITQDPSRHRLGQTSRSLLSSIYIRLVVTNAQSRFLRRNSGQLSLRGWLRAWPASRHHPLPPPTQPGWCFPSVARPDLHSSPSVQKKNKNLTTKVLPACAACVLAL